MSRACRFCDHFCQSAAALAIADPRDRHSNAEFGTCRRYPPRVFVSVDDGETDTRWPEVHRANRCGEFVLVQERAA
ncbi:hypothetical protein [uncultured Sphingomonas sp.]|uniref:hypothetical protein n=1 Tax=uncultured Sphingomonas sp. TaxID=158754 RepID=UPI0025E0EBE0|nr:hypothetical protein [uncultured Sphingomonas sp.]